MLKVKVFLNLAYNDVIRKVLLKGRFGLVDLESGQEVCFSSKAMCAAAAAPAALSTRLCGGPCCLLLDSSREMTVLSLSPLLESRLRQSNHCA